MTQCRDRQGRSIFTGKAKGLSALIEWIRALFTVSYGPEEAERRLHKVTVRQAMHLARVQRPRGRVRQV